MCNPNRTSSWLRLAGAWVAAGCVLALLANPLAPAQTITGNISGTVTDTSGAVLTNADITATNVANGFVFNTTTNKAGEYNLRFLPIGHYKVVITAAGFSKAEFGPFALEIGQEAKVNATLKVGSATTSVQVVSNFIPLLNTENNTVATTLTSTTIANMPLNGRNFSSLTIFLPGAIATSPTGVNGSAGSSRSLSASDLVSMNGNRVQTNNYSLDGIEINETINNLIGYNPAPDALGEMKIISANAPAEYGNVNGGDVLAITKAGTNQFHATAYWFLKNYLLDANSWGNKHQTTIIPKSHYTQNTFGATAGGPILKNRLFIFGDYEGYRYPSAGTTSTSVPDEKMRSGDFSELLSEATPVQLYDNSNNNATIGPVPYNGNQITIVNPAAKYLFAHPEVYPLPNAEPLAGSIIDGNYTGLFAGFGHNNQYDLRVDWKPSQKDTVTGRWLDGKVAQGTSKEPLLIVFPTTSSYPTKGIALNEVHVFSPSVVNEFRAGFTRTVWDQGVPIDYTGVFGTNGNTLLGINASQPFPGFAMMTYGCSLSHCNGLDVPTQIGNSGYLATTEQNNTFQYGDDLTWLKGRHSIKAGVEILRYQQNDYYPSDYGPNGGFVYNGEYTMDTATQAAGYSMADWELDAASSINRGGIDAKGNITGEFGQRQYRTGYYFQDDWKVKQNLTLNLGVRYDYDQPIYEVNNKTANINFVTKTIEYAGQGINTRALYNPTYTNIMPRLGFNYAPRNKMVVHGGFGMSTDMEGTGANLRLEYNPPYFNQSTATATQPTNTSPGNFFSVANGFTPGGILGTNVFRAWRNVKPSVVSEWSLATEYALTNTANLTVGYVGEQGQHLVQPVAYNQLTTPCPTAIGSVYGPTSSECYAVDPAPFANLVGQGVAIGQGGAVVGTSTEAMMTYNALQVSLRQHEVKGLEYTLNYTYGHNLTDSVGFFSVKGVSGGGLYAQNAYDNHAEYGPAGMDIRHSVNGTFVYELPFGRGRWLGSKWNGSLNEIAGGWRLAAAGWAYSGFPVNISGNDNSLTNASAARPNQYRKMHIVHRSLTNWFGTDPSAKACTAMGVDNQVCAYGNTAYGTFGTAHVNTQRAPGYQQYDLSFYKDFIIWREQKLTFRADAFNAFNISSYSPPDRGFADSSFGKITSVDSPQRQFQLSAKYSF